MERTVIRGERRKKVGTRDAWLIRREGWIPANLYGHGEANVNLQVRREDITRLLDEGHHMLTIQLDDGEDTGLLKEVQYDTYGVHIVHVDFARVSLDEVVETSVAIHTHGVPKGVSSGGILDVPHHEILIRGKARDIPESIDVEIGELLIGEALRGKDLKLPEGIELLMGPEEPIVIVQVPRGQDADTEEEESAEPEVIGKKEEEKKD